MLLGAATLTATLAVWFDRDAIRAEMTRRSGPAIHSLAVLPLDNLTGNASQDYFADGMTDALMTNLAQIGSLRVISRTSVMRYQGTRSRCPRSRASWASTASSRVRSCVPGIASGSRASSFTRLGTSTCGIGDADAAFEWLEKSYGGASLRVY